MQKVYESITGLKKAATKREAERKEMADVVEQEKLIEIKGIVYLLVKSSLIRDREASVCA
jgi:nucleosome binding factor SPN SPT16 subunit